MNRHLFPATGTLNRESKEKLLKQRGVVIWMTGLSGSGKTSIAIELEKALHAQGKLTQLLDGDQIRTGINNNLGFTETDRMENIRRIAEVAKLFVNGGIITICCFVSPMSAMRSQAREIIGTDDFLEVYVSTPLEVCEERDVKGLYAKAHKGEIRDFTGIQAPFEAPHNPDLELNTVEVDIEESVKRLLEILMEINKKHGYV
ncbi:MAG: adenylyl-sulfate kinase [Bacteroidia bacterium]